MTLTETHIQIFGCWFFFLTGGSAFIVLSLASHTFKKLIEKLKKPKVIAVLNQISDCVLCIIWFAVYIVLSHGWFDTLIRYYTLISSAFGAAFVMLAQRLVSQIGIKFKANIKSQRKPRKT
ncbi:MAG: hypothetical protein LBN25_01975 [Christensenellaceae bacterium]|jgi:uncharacterized membrane protein YdcZ (DUF606 family)|nr:hypothetical protein [Christensenellaceae bacterium]